MTLRRRALLMAAAIVTACLGTSMAVAEESGAPESGVRLARLSPYSDVDTRRNNSDTTRLSAADVSQYRMIFALQDKGRFDQADRLVARLNNRLLLGHVLAQRYLHPTDYSSTFEELAGWLDVYADHPQATRIHKLAAKRRPAKAPAPTAPVATRRENGREAAATRRNTARDARAKAWADQLADMAGDRPDAALRRLDEAASKDSFAAADRDHARWRVARSLLAAKNEDEALRQASMAAARSGAAEPRMHWTAGLAAWRLGRYEVAAQQFTSLANNSSASGEDVAAGAFWAARSYLMIRRPELVQRFLRIAAAASDDFYGMIAKAMAGEAMAFDWTEDGLKGGPDPLLLSFPAAQRAIALAEVGERELAEQELSLLASRARPEVAAGIVALAAELDLPSAEVRAAQVAKGKDGRQRSAAMFPVPKWQPQGGFSVDRALIWAMIRAESRFDPDAVSPRGAVGLMQIMPETGASVARSLKLKSYNGKASLQHPETNIRLGQAYIHKLRRSKVVGDSLIHLTLAYNAGLARLEGWMKQLRPLRDDPLLFLESVPVSESRLYAKKVLVNLWTYRARLQQPTPSLDQLAANVWPGFEQLDQAKPIRNARAN
jgi:soluble lytic murein transglycosylase-like protein